MNALHPALALSVLALVVLAAISDQRTGLIPNRLVGPGLLIVVFVRVGLTLSGVHESGWTSLTLFALGLLISGLIPLALYLCRALGAGDVKLLAVCGAGLGPVLGLEAELYAFGFGALYALGHAAYGGVLWQTLRGSAVLMTNPLIPRRLRKPVPIAAQRPMPFGPAICVGVLCTVALHWGLS